MKGVVISLVIFFFGLSIDGLEAQRFSFLAEVGGLKGQVDGDKIQGFYYNGYTFGIGSNYTFTPEHFLAIKTTYYNQGSRRKSDLVTERREGIQLELDLNSIGLELAYKFAPYQKNYFYGVGFVRHQLVDLNYEIIESQLQGSDLSLNPDQIRSGFNSFKFYGGFDVFERASIYASLEASVSNMLDERFYEVRKLTPYSLAVIFSYEIFSAEEVKMKSRPGKKSRTKPKIKATSRPSPFSY
jgi:hypothetical protein